MSPESPEEMQKAKFSELFEIFPISAATVLSQNPRFTSWLPKKKPKPPNQP